MGNERFRLPAAILLLVAVGGGAFGDDATAGAGEPAAPVVQADVGAAVYLPLGALAQLSNVGFGVAGRVSLPLIAGTEFRLHGDVQMTYQVFSSAGSGIVDMAVGVGLGWGLPLGPIVLAFGATYGVIPHLAWGGSFGSDAQAFLDQFVAPWIDVAINLGDAGALTIRPTYIIYFEQQDTLGQMLGAAIGFRFQ